jgi:hypothetical protein
MITMEAPANREEISDFYGILADLSLDPKEPLLVMYDWAEEPTDRYDDFGRAITDYVVMIRDDVGRDYRFEYPSDHPRHLSVFFFGEFCQGLLQERTGDPLPVCPLHCHEMALNSRDLEPHWSCTVHSELWCPIGSYWVWREQFEDGPNGQ